MAKAYLVLSDGTVYEGEGFGAEGASVGELVFNTGVVGYIETLTDPSYYGQIVMQTFPLIGNYGIIEADFEGDCCVRGYVVREWCDTPSNFRCEYDIDTFLKARGVPGICGVDTRAITQRLREQGVMNAMICRELPADMDALRRFAITDAVRSVSTGRTELFPAVGPKRFNVTLVDYGAKHNIERELQRRGCDVKAVPYDTTAEQILADRPDGVMLSNGPGDPAENTTCIAEIRKLLGKVPIFGICLGHQLTALAAGGRTEKLKYGHRGANQPCKDLVTGHTYITSQNHGYAVVSDSLPVGTVRFVNANDMTCEGVDYPEYRAFTVQFHPEACAGPMDTSFLFDKFTDLMGGAGNAAE
ncbi:MAG: glutamine-hydrolyzing carbamoyl-phosphate synthase small subunit [Clostridia bacterium]|nr:glutamine-hydrolyzing carbamoyl-phosphate synthase small subunit [Clostridia bacterium]